MATLTRGCFAALCVGIVLGGIVALGGIVGGWVYGWIG